MIEIQYSGTALLLLVNHIETMAPSALLTYLSSEKKCFVAVQPVMEQYESTFFKKNFCNQMKITDDFCYEWKPSRAYHKIDRAKMNGTQRREGTGKSMKNALHVAKGTSWAEVMLNSEKIKPIAIV